VSGIIAPSVKTGKFLLRVAWGVEICAASFGLLFSWITLFPNNIVSLDPNTQATAIIAAMPFVIVAIVELTKIPLATACYFTTSRVARYAFAFSLLLVSIITFETFSNGFQQGLQVRLAKLKKIQKKKTQIEVKIQAAKEEKSNLNGLTLQEIDRNASDAIINLNKRKKEDLDIAEGLIDGERSRLGGPKKEFLEIQISEIKKDYQRMVAHYESLIKEVDIKYKLQVTALKLDTKAIRDSLKTHISSVDRDTAKVISDIKVKKEKINKMRGVVVFGDSRLEEVRTSYNSKRKNIKQSIISEKESINTRIGDLSDDISKIKAELADTAGGAFWNPDLVKTIEKKTSQINDLRVKRMSLNIKSQVSELDNQEQASMKTIRSTIKKENSEIINELQGEIQRLDKELVELKIQKENLSNELRNTTVGSQRELFLAQQTKDRQRLNESLIEEKNKNNELMKERQAELSQVLTQQQIELYPKEEAYQREIKNIAIMFDDLKNAVEERKNKSLSDFNRRDNRVTEIAEDLAALNAKNSDYEAELSNEGEKTLVGQWSLFFFNDMAPNHVKVVAVIWFGSIAAITAWLGTILAFASLVLRYSHEKEHKPSGFVRSMQKYIADARRLKRKPKIKEIRVEVEKTVEVVKEIPVTKIEIQEVPKIVIQKEIVHVPIASDDLSILDFSNRLSNKSKESGGGSDKQGNFNKE
jgi:hypothetical protein